MSIIYELRNDNDNWAYILTVDNNKKFTQREKNAINEITWAIEQHIKILNYKGES